MSTEEARVDYFEGVRDKESGLPEKKGKTDWYYEGYNRTSKDSVIKELKK